jgi:gentisate 1,2-dioxygenase
MSEYIKAYEYESNVNPKLAPIPIVKKNVKDCIVGINYIDNGSGYKVDYKATSPNLLASFIVLEVANQENNQHITRFNRSDNVVAKEINASSHLFYILDGKCRFTIKEEVYTRGEEYGEVYIDKKYTDYIVECGEIFICPVFLGLTIENVSENETTEMYYVNDSPLLNYLGAEAENTLFTPCVYDKKFIQENLHTLSDPQKNRKGILLSNTDTENLGINTITPTLWALYNELPPNTKQRPHRHNSVALDLCISCTDSENIYTLVGDELDEQGNIVNPQKVNWKQGEMFITPPGLWHSHHNDGDTYAYILPIQDAGLLLYQRILGIQIK